MLRPISKQLLLSLLGILLVLVFWKFFTIMSFPDSETILDKGELLQINSQESFHQTFVANRDGLSKLEFLLRTPGIKAGDTIQVTLADETCKNTLRQGILEVPFLNSDNLYVFQFPRIEDSHDKKYCALLSYQSTLSKNKYLRFFTTTKTNEAMTLILPHGEEAENQSLSMRLVYNNANTWQDLGELNKRISQYKPWFLKHYYIASVGLLFVILSVTLITALITLKIENSDN